MELVLAAWVNARRPQSDEEAVALDGKAMRGAATAEHKAPHLLAFCTPDSQETLLQVRVSENVLSVCIEDRGGTRPLPEEPEVPDIEAKLAELETPRGWGLFLIKNMVDEMHVTNDVNHHIVELIVYLEGENRAR